MRQTYPGVGVVRPYREEARRTHLQLEYYLDKARKIEDMGADSFCIKDMAGIISPYDAYDLVSALKASLKIPVHLHSHYTSGMASMACLKAIEAGADGIDTCVAPFALQQLPPGGGAFRRHPAGHAL